MNMSSGSLLPSPNTRLQTFSNPFSKPTEHTPSISPSSSHINNEERKVENSVEVTCANSKDPKRNRTSFLTQQSEILEKAFQSERYITKTQRVQLAQQLDLPENTIKVWFQNRRMKERRKSMMLPSNIVNNPWARERLLEYANELCQMREYRNYHEISENPSSSSTHQTSCDAPAFTSNSSFSVESFYSSDFKPPDT
nr:hypothetical transcript [Hymenolepis microstoma]